MQEHHLLSQRRRASARARGLATLSQQSYIKRENHPIRNELKEFDKLFEAYAEFASVHNRNKNIKKNLRDVKP